MNTKRVGLLMASFTLLTLSLAACSSGPQVVQPTLEKVKPIPPEPPKEPTFGSTQVAGIPINCVFIPSEKIGKEEEVTAITVQTKSSTTGSSTNNATYTPPSGYVVISHTVLEDFKYGIASLAVNTQPANWSYELTQDIQSKYDLLIDGAVKKGWSEYAAKLRQEQSEMSKYYTSVRASHHNINAVVNARGSGFPSYKTGAIGIRVIAKIRYTGVDNILADVVKCHQNQLAS